MTNESTEPSTRLETLGLPQAPTFTRIPMRAYEKDGRTMFSKVDAEMRDLTEDNCEFVAIRTTDFYVVPHATATSWGAVSSRDNLIDEVFGLLTPPGNIWTGNEPAWQSKAWMLIHDVWDHELWSDSSKPEKE